MSGVNILEFSSRALSPRLTRSLSSAFLRNETPLKVFAIGARGEDWRPEPRRPVSERPVVSMPEGESLRDLDSLILSMRLLIRFELDGRGAASQGLGWSARVKDLRSWKCTLIFLSSREASSSVASFMYSVILRGLLALHLPADRNWSRHDELGEQLRSGCLSLRASLNCWYSLTEQPSGMAEGE